MNYSNILKNLRIENNLTQTNLANLLEINRVQYNQYENDYNTIPIKHLNTICNYYNVSLDYVFNFTNILNYENSSKDINKDLSGKRLKEFRKELKITQSKIAEELNSSYGTIAGYESGRYIIATPFLYTICKKYNISADYLLGKIDEPKYFK